MHKVYYYLLYYDDYLVTIYYVVLRGCQSALYYDICYLCIISCSVAVSQIHSKKQKPHFEPFVLDLNGILCSLNINRK